MSFDHNISACYNANCIANYLAINSENNNLPSKSVHCLSMDTG
ncbi:hypothetical protein AOR13_3747 [Alteromonas stellipolaris LMG 21856]|nr:hypothetical protein AOR13_3747 [Alteromonas stellipolaris LMG 21856]